MSNPLENPDKEPSEDLIRENVPYDASPQYVAEIAEVSIEQSLSDEEVAEKLDYSKGLIRRNLNYGRELGFFEGDNDKIALTERGKTLAHLGLSESTEWVFHDAINEYKLYSRVIESAFIRGEVDDVRGQDALTHGSIQKIIREEFNFDLGDRVLIGAARTFMRTLDAAGYGRYVRGDGDYPTRVVLSSPIYEFASDVQKEDGSKKEEEVQENREETEGDDEVVDMKRVVEINVSVQISEDSDPSEIAKKVKQFEQELDKEDTL